MAALKALADEHGGNFSTVRVADLEGAKTQPAAAGPRPPSSTPPR
jgi:hypothetical protein